MLHATRSARLAAATLGTLIPEHQVCPRTVKAGSELCNDVQSSVASCSRLAAGTVLKRKQGAGTTTLIQPTWGTIPASLGAGEQSNQTGCVTDGIYEPSSAQG